MHHSWSKTVFPIAAIFSFRMLGLFLLIPVFSLEAATLQGASPSLIGIALGSYGLTQGLLQIPFGLLSDKVGRKPMITLGLILFAIGSVIGALTDSIYGMILARIIQGTGAIGSVLIALLADLTPNEARTKAMAVIGMTIGTSFSLAMVLSPAISHHYGLAGIFYLTAVLAVLGILLIHLVIPKPQKEHFHGDSETNPSLFKTVILNLQLQRLNLGIFCQHFILTATFFAIPMLLKEHMKQGVLSQQWHFYLPLMLCSFILMIPFIILAEKKKQMKQVFLFSIITIALTQGILAFTYEAWSNLCLLMFAYFVAFNILEASLPSLISKEAKPKTKGTAMGIYSTSQFLGIFAGGALAGVLYQWQSSHGIFIANALLALLWFLAAASMSVDTSLKTLILTCSSFDKENESLIKTLLNISGVKEVLLAVNEETIYLIIDTKVYQSGEAERALSLFSTQKNSN